MIVVGKVYRNDEKGEVLKVSRFRSIEV